MKRISILFLIFGLFLLSSCSDEEVNVKEKLIGTWDVEQIDSIMQVSGKIDVHKLLSNLD